MRRQQGIGALAIFFILFLILMIALLAMKVTPAYLEFFAVKGAITAMSDEVETGNPREIRKAFDRRAMIDDIRSIAGRDLEIGKESGITVVTASYQVSVPLFANISLLIDFSASTAK